MSSDVNKLVQEVFFDLANALETGSLDQKLKIGLTIDGSEHGLDNMLEAAKLASGFKQFDVVLIGSRVETDLELIEVNGEKEVHDKMEELLNINYLQGCVTLHYNFPIGVATVGKVITPALGKEMFIATTTGTTSSNKNQAMVLNAINGIAVAKANGIENPSVGVLNVDGASTIKRALEQLKDNGYPINFASSKRSDGGLIMRGNDLLMGSVDVMVCDSLTGNILMKMFSAYNTGGNYEALGFGYGPGVGDKYDKNICIISRASGINVVANALKFAYDMALGKLVNKSFSEYELAHNNKLNDVLETLLPKKQEEKTEVKMPEKEIVIEQISGIDVIDLDDAVQCLWKEGIYAESGMGCTGPIVLVNTNSLDKALVILKDNNFN